METPNAQAGLQNMILHGYTYPPSEIIKGVELPPGVEVTPLATTDDGTQIWKITHNGVDTHPIHWHLYDVQLINRVGWDGIVRKPEANELGWKDTVRVSPLEDTIVALRPIIPQIPAEWGGLPNSIRLLDPSMPEGEYLMGANTTQREAMGMPLMAFNPDGEPVDILNHFVNFSWEYVFHCHILSHEEMDMMHAQVVGVTPAAPTFVSAVRTANGSDGRYIITWIDNSKNETAFVIERRVAGSTDLWSVVATVQSTQLDVIPFVNTGDGPGTGTRSYTTNPVGSTVPYEFRVYAVNVVGDVWDYSNPAFNEIPAGGGWPTLTLASASDGGNGDPTGTPPAAPTDLTGMVFYGPQVQLSWMDNAVDETGFIIERSDDGSAFAQIDTLAALSGTGIMTYLDATVLPGHAYEYQVYALNGGGSSGLSNSVTLVIAPAPADPTNLVTTVQGALSTGPRVRLVYRDNATDETNFVVERSENGGAFAYLETLPPRVNRGNVTYYDNTVLGGHIYEYRVFAVNGPSPSRYSNVAAASVPPVPADPSNFIGTTRITGTTTRIDLSWMDNSNNESRFVIQRATDPGFTTNLATYNRGANNIAFAQTGLPFGVTYYYRIMAENIYGQSNWVLLDPFPISTPTTPPPPAAPSAFAATTTLTNGGTRVRINLTWMDNSDNETRFVVQRAADPNFTVGLVSVNRGANTTAYAQGNLARGTTYYYRIMAQNTYGDSVWVYLTVTTP